MKLLFAACARDCASVVASNISTLLSFGDLPWCEEVRIFIAENSSKDRTREVILDLAARDDRIVPVLLEDIDAIMPVRETRLAFCRDRLLADIRDYAAEALYVPIDLDARIASSLDEQSFKDTCQLVASEKCSGVFPSSSPYYYDIHALRHPDWCPGSCWQEVHTARVKGSLLSLLVYIRYVSFRQKSHSRLTGRGLIPVKSAFGGIGVYSLQRVKEAGARYSSTDLVDEQLSLCEHVRFNQFLDKLYINPEWTIEAPHEHIQFRLLTRCQKARRLFLAGLDDLKRIPLFVLKLFSGAHR
jgi:hypothetical protein